jgi:hypothetical protein
MTVIAMPRPEIDRLHVLRGVLVERISVPGPPRCCATQASPGALLPAHLQPTPLGARTAAQG